MKNEVIIINQETIYDETVRYFSRMCGLYDNKNSDRKNSIKKAIDKKAIDKKEIDKKAIEKKEIDKKAIEKKEIDKKAIEKKEIEKKDIDIKNIDKEIIDNVKKIDKLSVVITPFKLGSIDEDNILINEDKFLIDKDKLSINGIDFVCSAFEQIKASKIIGIYVYIMTLKNAEVEGLDLLDTFYMDTWATACLDAARDTMKDLLKTKAYLDFSIKGKEVFVSNSFGPGYYGMDIAEVGKFLQILDAKKIDVTVTKSGLMMPQKSNVGFYIITDTEDEKIGKDCEGCIGSHSGCKFCKIERNYLKSESKESKESKELKEVDNTMKITFLPDNIEARAIEGESILEVAGKAGIMINGNCNHTGRCGKCKVKVTIGKVSKLDEMERASLSEKEIQQGFRLSCRTFLLGDTRVFITGNQSEDKRKSRLLQMPAKFLETATGVNPFESADITTTGLQSKNKDPRSEVKYGIAFDIGTTSVVAMLWDMFHNQLVDVQATINPQSVYGADVISRITYCLEDVSHLNKLHKSIIDCCNHLIKKLCKTNMLKEKEIQEALIVANTTMSHLFLGISPEGLARTPFLPGFYGSQKLLSKEIGLQIKPTGIVYVLPNIAGHVGSDITAGILATDLKNKVGLHLLIDIGTNGEIVLANDGRLFACSTAAGPAFEGAGVRSGMRAAKGAIEGVEIKKGEIILAIIDDEKPIGICGSGLIDAIAQLLEAGIIDETGHIFDKNSLQDKKIQQENNIDENLINRIRNSENGNEFILYQDGDESNDIVITQGDIRQVQLAKAAILAGVLTLLKEANKKVESIDNIIIAGAFGNYIKKESALRIGLFPSISMNQEMSLSKIVSVGNAAGAGASMALLSATEREMASEVIQEVIHVELANYTGFDGEYMRGMNFPKDQE